MEAAHHPIKNFFYENILITLIYWGISHLTFIMFNKLGIQPMPIWPPAGLALVACLYRGWKIAPGIAMGVIFSNHFSLGAAWDYSASVAIFNTLGPMVGAAIIKWRITEKLEFNNGMDVFIFFLAALVVKPMLAALGGVGFKYYFGLISGDLFFKAFLKWMVAHILGTIFLGVPLLTFIKMKYYNEEKDLLL